MGNRISHERRLREATLTVGHFINTYEKCPQCGEVDQLEVRNHDMIWHDGEVWCRRCDVYVRGYDAG
jgi:Zn ribbon nucleic-acid-binding protein